MTTLRQTTRLQYRNATPAQLAEAVMLLTLRSRETFERGERRMGYVYAAEARIVARMLPKSPERYMKAQAVAQSATCVYARAGIVRLIDCRMRAVGL